MVLGSLFWLVKHVNSTELFTAFKLFLFFPIFNILYLLTLFLLIVPPPPEPLENLLGIFLRFLLLIYDWGVVPFPLRPDTFLQLDQLSRIFRLKLRFGKFPDIFIICEPISNTLDGLISELVDPVFFIIGLEVVTEVEGHTGGDFLFEVEILFYSILVRTPGHCVECILDLGYIADVYLKHLVCCFLVELQVVHLSALVGAFLFELFH